MNGVIAKMDLAIYCGEGNIPIILMKLQIIINKFADYEKKFEKNPQEKIQFQEIKKT